MYMYANKFSSFVHTWHTSHKEEHKSFMYTRLRSGCLIFALLHVKLSTYLSWSPHQHLVTRPALLPTTRHVTCCWCCMHVNSVCVMQCISNSYNCTLTGLLAWHMPAYPCHVYGMQGFSCKTTYSCSSSCSLCIIDPSSPLICSCNTMCLGCNAMTSEFCPVAVWNKACRVDWLVPVHARQWLLSN